MRFVNARRSGQSIDEHTVEYGLPRTWVESKKEIGTGFPEQFVSILGMNNAGLYRQEKSLATACCQRSLEIEDVRRGHAKIIWIARRRRPPGCLDYGRISGTFGGERKSKDTKGWARKGRTVSPDVMGGSAVRQDISAAADMDLPSEPESDHAARLAHRKAKKKKGSVKRGDGEAENKRREKRKGKWSRPTSIRPWYGCSQSELRVRQRITFRAEPSSAGQIWKRVCAISTCWE